MRTREDKSQCSYLIVRDLSVDTCGRYSVFDSLCSARDIGRELHLNQEAENIVSSVSSDRIVIVCKDSEEKIIVSLLTQIGWKSKIQSIVTENDLVYWYNKALTGVFSKEIGDRVLSTLYNEILREFPATNFNDLNEFKKSKGYDLLSYAGVWREA